MKIYGHTRDYLYAPDEGTVRWILSMPLLFIGQIYFLCTRMRRALYDAHFLKRERVGATVIGVGNLTLGGSGKTTVTMELAEYLREQGCSVAVLSRGYRGSRSGAEPVTVSGDDGIHLNVREAGDEPYMMAQRLDKGIIVMIGKDRVKAAHKAEREFGCRFLILDDAYQYLSLQKDLEILLINEEDLGCRARPVPAGRFREPFSSSKDADIVVIMRGLEPTGEKRVCDAGVLSGKTVVEAVPRALDLRTVLPETGQTRIEDLKGSHVLAFTSIARTGMFREILQRLEPGWFDVMEFPDHHFYCTDELYEIRNMALKHEAVIITTEKDRVKVDWSIFEGLRCFTFVPRYDLFDNENELKKMVDRIIEEGDHGET